MHNLCTIPQQHGFLLAFQKGADPTPTSPKEENHKTVPCKKKKKNGMQSSILQLQAQLQLQIIQSILFSFILK